MSETGPTTTSAEARAAGQAAAQAAETRAHRAFGWYRAMAFVTGVMLLVLTAEMVLKYVFGVAGYEDETKWWTARPVMGAWVAILHGWIYVVYAATVLNLWSVMRWGLGRVVALVAAGVVPVLSFVLERKAHGWVEADLPAVTGRARVVAERRTTLGR
ncbi:DUF3817 domain-containing protein [Georgenia sp. Z1344]|uniref:DUF3817 domain-containing protein n=1 Tax=Georgenia sp. Z1344 TaxID=3416706 RepID=UPI003CF5BE03